MAAKDYSSGEDKQTDDWAKETKTHLPAVRLRDDRKGAVSNDEDEDAPAARDPQDHLDRRTEAQTRGDVDTLDTGDALPSPTGPESMGDTSLPADTSRRHSVGPKERPVSKKRQVRLAGGKLSKILTAVLAEEVEDIEPAPTPTTWRAVEKPERVRQPAQSPVGGRVIRRQVKDHASESKRLRRQVPRATAEERAVLEWLLALRFPDEDASFADQADDVPPDLVDSPTWQRQVGLSDADVYSADITTWDADLLYRRFWPRVDGRASEYAGRYARDELSKWPSPQEWGRLAKRMKPRACWDVAAELVADPRNRAQDIAPDGEKMDRPWRDAEELLTAAHRAIGFSAQEAEETVRELARLVVEPDEGDRCDNPNGCHNAPRSQKGGPCSPCYQHRRRHKGQWRASGVGIDR